VKTQTLEERVHDALARVMDPELPVCAITDLGMVQATTVSEESISVTLLPTFVGCPALDVIRSDVKRALDALGSGREVRVSFAFDPPWTTDRMNDRAREALKGYGVAPPVVQIAVPCPYCGSPDTRLESEFGPTPCRSVRYCNACRNPFERFKPKQVG
jgi:ring-1,2-phenylacetyl-CoA epoxidase subunit PaaD